MRKEGGCTCVAVDEDAVRRRSTPCAEVNACAGLRKTTQEDARRRGVAGMMR